MSSAAKTIATMFLTGSVQTDQADKPALHNEACNPVLHTALSALICTEAESEAARPDSVDIASSW